MTELNDEPPGKTSPTQPMISSTSPVRTGTRDEHPSPETSHHEPDTPVQPLLAPPSTAVIIVRTGKRDEPASRQEETKEVAGFPGWCGSLESRCLTWLRSFPLAGQLLTLTAAVIFVAVAAVVRMLDKVKKKLIHLVYMIIAHNSDFPYVICNYRQFLIENVLLTYKYSACSF